MNITVHQRPGVYSAYDASSVVSGRESGKWVGLAAINRAAEPGVVQAVTSYERAAALFGEEDGAGMAELIRLALKNGAAGVAAVAVEEESGYEEAFRALESEAQVSVMLCGSTDVEVQKKLKDSVLRASQSRRERIAVVAGAAAESVDELLQRAGELNCERMVLVAPGGVDQKGEGCAGLMGAAAVAGAIAGERDPAVPLGGAELLGLSGLERRLEDGELDRLLLGGVTPLEQLGGAVSVVRGVTTRSAAGETADGTWRELTTIRVVDDVIPAVRDALSVKFRRAKNTARSRSAIRAQVVLELEEKLAREIITSYEGVSVTADSEDPTRCLVDFSFTVAHGLNQIWLTAHITV